MEILLNKILTQSCTRAIGIILRFVRNIYENRCYANEYKAGIRKRRKRRMTMKET